MDGKIRGIEKGMAEIKEMLMPIIKREQEREEVKI